MSLKQGIHLGIIQKYQDSKFEQHPWKAFARRDGTLKPLVMLGCFFPNEFVNAKQMAENAVVKNYLDKHGMTEIISRQKQLIKEAMDTAWKKRKESHGREAT